MIESIDTGVLPSTGPVSDAVRAGGLVWMVALSEDPKTGEIVTGDIEVQARRTLENLEMAAKAAGGSLADVVQVQVFLTDAADARGMNKVYAEFFSKPYPVRATVVVKELLAQGLRIEMTATAAIAR